MRSLLAATLLCSSCAFDTAGLYTPVLDDGAPPLLADDGGPDPLDDDGGLTILPSGFDGGFTDVGDGGSGSDPDANPLADPRADAAPAPLLCDPATSAGCNAGWACRLNGSPQGVLIGCEPAGNLVQGYACVNNLQCAPGYGCFNGPYGGVCLHYCHADSSADCSALPTTSCQPFNPLIYVNSRPMGVCN